jgi:hypothetical protein
VMTKSRVALKVGELAQRAGVSIAAALRKMIHTEPSLPGINVGTIRAAGGYIYEAIAQKRTP